MILGVDAFPASNADEAVRVLENCNFTVLPAWQHNFSLNRLLQPEATVWNDPHGAFEEMLQTWCDYIDNLQGDNLIIRETPIHLAYRLIFTAPSDNCLDAGAIASGAVNATIDNVDAVVMLASERANRTEFLWSSIYAGMMMEYASDEQCERFFKVGTHEGDKLIKSKIQFAINTTFERKVRDLMNFDDFVSSLS